MLFRLAALSASAASAASLTITPETVTNCGAGGLGRVLIGWSGASGPVEVRVGHRQGTSMTGLSGILGSAWSGDWVTDGMTFFLVNQQGRVEAEARARVRCGGVAVTALAGGYLPLQVGNQWVYRVDNRRVTASYTRYKISSSEEIGGTTYYRMTDDSGAEIQRLRADADGRILRINSANAESVLLDPRAAPRETLSGPLGRFSDVAHVSATDGLIRQEAYYVGGIGLVKSESWLLTGSSGGFAAGLELVEARLDGGARLVTPAPLISLSIEAAVLDVSGRRVTNCAVPSYCVACGLIGADPPNTYKPCVQVRVEGTRAAAVELRDSAGRIVYRDPPADVAFRYLQLPLYVNPNEPLAAGQYTLAATVEGEAAASVRLRIE